MTAPAPPATRLRCPYRDCGHFPNRTGEHVELLEGFGEWRHALHCEDDRGHTWTVSWTTETRDG